MMPTGHMPWTMAQIHASGTNHQRTLLSCAWPATPPW